MLEQSKKDLEFWALPVKSEVLDSFGQFRTVSDVQKWE